MEGSGFKTVQMNGEYGNLCAAISEFTADGTEADSVIDFLRLPAGCYVTDVRAISEDLGGATMAVGYRYVDGSAGAAAGDAFIGAEALSGIAAYEGLPLKFEDEFIVTGTVGGAAATGTVAVIVEYVFDGTP